MESGATSSFKKTVVGPSFSRPYRLCCKCACKRPRASDTVVLASKHKIEVSNVSGDDGSLLSLSYKPQEKRVSTQ